MINFNGKITHYLSNNNYHINTHDSIFYKKKITTMVLLVVIQPKISDRY